MTDVESSVPARGGRMRIPRSRGALSGLLLIVLGAWGALIPFIGPYFDFAYTPDEAWAWTTARGWLEVLPGAVAAFGGLLLLVSGNRATAMFGGWLAVVAGAWFVVGPAFAGPLNIGDVGVPVADSDAKRALLEISYFYGLGALIVFFGATALGRLSVRSARDIQYAQRPAVQGDRTAATPATTATATTSTERVETPAERVEPTRRRSRFAGLFGRRGTPVTR
ncbi:hypothetical protein OG921_19960 [Aldersonia sp. NBC_00410]|uniref:hypothetical protein n=1 Tax=Aldersonia sp. NBC_00410 TaxID=2975954 RepID=UPI00224D9BF2|nr:hypothetical protein [Aldersonia sp. NBC_00410]MCX5045448.1 hypothetical protein [Aldersonia sp. NBC_00410]